MLNFTLRLKILQFQQQATQPAANSKQQSKRKNSKPQFTGKKIESGNSFLGSVLTR